MSLNDLNLNSIRESFVNSIILGLKVQFKRDGFVIPISVLLFKNGKHQFVQPPSKEDFEELDNSELMETYILSLRMICEMKKPIAIAIISESYAYESNDMSMNIEGIKNLIKENEGEIENVPGVKDIAVITIETTLTSEIVTMEIDRYNKKLYNQKRMSTATSIFGGVLNRMNYN